MGTNTGLGIGIGIPFKNNALGGDKPYFPPELKARMIGVWTNYGKKNTDTDRNIIKNKIPNVGGDLEILNAAYKLNSGFGEYSEDFTTWTKSSKITSVDSESFDFVTNVNWNLLYYKSNIGKDIPSFKVRIKLKGEGKVFYNYITSEGVYTNKAITSEEYVTPISYNTKYTGETPVNCGFSIGITSEEGSGTITQIPNFEDAFVTDGINDMIVSQKTLQEMGVTKELTIVSMIHQISWRGSASVPLTNYIRPKTNEYVRSHVSNIGKTGIYGYVCYDISNSGAGNSHVVNTILGDKNDYSINIVGDLSQGKFSVQGYINDNGNILETSSVAHYWTFAVLGKATEDEINLIIGNYNLDRSLKPDILCNIGKQGITNDNHADFNDKLIDYSGNGRDIQMNNLAWKGGSGIAAKQYETFKDWTSESSSTSTITQIDEFTRIVESTTNGYWVSRIRRDFDLNKVYDAINVYLYQDNNFLVHECKYEVDGVKYAIPISEPVGKGYHKLEMYTKDRYTELPENAENVILSEWYFPKSTKGSIKYSVIPSYKGGILLDGINDFGKVTGMPIYKDYTFIIDYERISYTSEGWGGAIVSKSPRANNGAFISMMANSAGTNKQLFSFGGVTAFIKDDLSRILFWQTKYKSENTELTVGEGVDGDTLWLGALRDNDSRFFNGAIYSLMSFPYSMSEFLIERQLKKHKLGTLYPNMVEFRPVIKSSVELVNKPSFAIRGTSTLLNAGDYIPENSEIWVVITMNNVADRITKFVINGNTIDIPSSAYNPSTMKYGFPFTIDSKSPQKITMTIEQDENYVKWNPVVESNVEYQVVDSYIDNYPAVVGNYYPINSQLRIAVTTKGAADEVTSLTINGTSLGTPSVNGNRFTFNGTLSDKSPQKINITIDEYIRFEDIVQPYPSLFTLIDYDTEEVYSWGSKLKVGARFKGDVVNLLPNMYEWQGNVLYNGEVLNWGIKPGVVAKEMVFSWNMPFKYLIDNNEPKVILSPRLLRIPNSSYKILGYIPDISGHGNHGVIHNSVYAKGSGVNEDGSYQFDGVDDFVTIPTVTGGGKQVLMKVNNNTINSILYDQRSSGASPNSLNCDFAIYTTDTDNNNLIAYQSRLVGKTYIDGILNTNITCEDLLGVLHNITITCDIVVPNNGVVPNIGRGGVLKDLYSNMALYDFMLFDNISTDDKIKELNEYVGIEAKVELPPYYWDAYGKTNLDGDKATIQQRGVAVGDYDLTNYNHAYEGMSGYNGYPVVFGANKTWTNKSNGYVTSITSNTIHITNVLNAGLALLYSYVKYNGNLQNIKEIPPFKIEIKGLEGRSKFIYKYLATSDATKETNLYLGNGTHELPKSFLPTEALVNDAMVGFSISPIEEGVTNFLSDITIEVLPEYENGLAYDGITDYSKNANIPVLTDYTYIYKRTIINIPTNAATLLKGADKTNGGAFIADYGNKWQFNFGQYNIIQGIADGINWQTVNSFNGTSINKGENTDDSGITVAKFSNRYTSMVFYKLILYPKTISLLEINFLKNLMEKDEIIDLNNPIFIKNE